MPRKRTFALVAIVAAVFVVVTRFNQSDVILTDDGVEKRSGIIYDNRQHVDYDDIATIQFDYTTLDSLLGRETIRIHTSNVSENEMVLQHAPREKVDEIKRQSLNSTE